MIKILVIFDHLIDPDGMERLLLGADGEMLVFPLTSTAAVISKVVGIAKRSHCGVRIVQTAKEINLSADRLRSRYINFIADVPDRVRYKGKNLREIFSIDNLATLWWFSSVSEKNTIESEAFNRLAQLDAIVDLIEREGIKKVLFGCGSQRLRKALVPYLRSNRIEFKALPTFRQELTLKKRIREHQGLFYWKHLVCLLYAFMQSVMKAQKIRRRSDRLERVPGKGSSLVLVTYYPYFDIEQAKQGVFKNNYYVHLQDALEREGRDLVWVAMSVNNTSMSFNESFDYFERFVKGGQNIYFLEEFSSPWVFMKAVWVMLKNAVKFLNAEKTISAIHTFGRYNFYPLLRDDWYESFTGERGYRGVVQYQEFSSMFKGVKAEGYVYCCEMRAWEKALIYARDSVGSKAFLFCYQHAAVSRMLLNYFNDPKEITGDSCYALPKPDMIACNGSLSYDYMMELGWTQDRLTKVEAVRYNHLKKYLNRSRDKEKKIVLLAFSISPAESSSILSIAYEALKDVEDMEVWIRPHPFLGVREVFRIAGIALNNFPFKIKDEPLEKVIEQARVVIAGESSVSIEALAGGCEVVIVNVPEWINMSPLRAFKSTVVRTVGSPQELRQATLDIFGKKYDAELNFAEGKKIVDGFFCLNRESDTPEKFMRALLRRGEK